MYSCRFSVSLGEGECSGSSCVTILNHNQVFSLIILYRINLIFADYKNKSLKTCIHIVLLIFDTGVYTRNRNFRLYKSSKIGKYVPLEVAEDNKFYPIQSKNISIENQYFLSALVSNVRYTGPELNHCVFMNIY